MNKGLYEGFLEEMGSNIGEEEKRPNTNFKKDIYLICNGYWYWNDGLKLKLLLVDGRIVDVDAPIKPYFFIRKIEKGKVEELGLRWVKVDLMSYDGYKVIKVEVDKPTEVKRYRDRFKESYEADIPFMRRLAVDGLIQYGKGKIWFYDIEVDDTEIPEAGKSRILSIALMSEDGKEYWLYNEDEKELLIEFIEILEKERIGIIVGWNNHLFDDVFIEKGLEKYGLDVERWKLMIKVDLMELFKKWRKHKRYALDYVAEQEGVGRKVERIGKVIELGKEELKRYNMMDAELLRRLEERCKLVDLLFELSQVVNLCVDDLTPVRMIDSMLLRLCRKEGLVLPNVKKQKQKSPKGAIILTPKKDKVVGENKYVVVLDYKSLYPNIIVNEGLSWEWDDKKLLVKLVKEFLEKREYYRNKFKETGDERYDMKQQVYKVLSNAVFGATMNVGFRLYDWRIGDKIMSKGRENLMKVINFVEDIGFEVIYGDTDSIFVYVEGSWEEVEKIVKMLERRINEYMYPYRMKVEKVFDAIIFLSRKKYAGITVDGELEVKGLELIRSDWCDLAGEVQKEIIMRVLRGEDIENIKGYIKEIKEKLERGELDEKLVMRRSLSKKIEEYKVEQPHVRVAKKLIQMGYKGMLWVEYVWVKGGDVEPVVDGKIPENIDRKWYWKKQIYPIIERIMKVVVGQRKLEVFG